MALNSTGAISLGGSTTGQSIAVELGQSATATISLNDTAVRTLAGAATGAISMNDLRGKTNVVPSSQSYTTPGTYSWIAPAGVTSVSVVAVGGGGAGGCSNGPGSSPGGGGGLGWKNGISVTPGTSYNVQVGGQNQDSYFISNTTVAGKTATSSNAGQFRDIGGTYVGDGGGNGGDNNYVINTRSTTGGGGAGGYTGNGGGAGYQGQRIGGGGTMDNGSFGGQSGSGGGGGGGNYGGGGGVGLFGQGTSGTGTPVETVYYPPPTCNPDFYGYGYRQGYGGGGGSGGENAIGTYVTFSYPCQSSVNVTLGRGGNYGGGGIGNGGGSLIGGKAGTGAVRIVWPGDTRQFPSTSVGSP